ncbi:hypothetical protein BDY17DRAFT_250087 [Neohortaea acidophila]|uniref:Uncharacterized protein n=1 Tax=Neohortaea acidophila TaxID=245834 RepID=A0A6A6PUP9_9PEZI|nr:uncharacterized protein BDY17DRAFT_250087 [Neohortaea acidophila]KAF2483496.1 hypothetical protein BDY17DRAFT_250087 [Neohortaea acidophila]
MADAIEAFLAQHQQGEEPHIPPRHSTCCCGNDACPYLKHNQAALDGLERDVSTAARLGQALLMRHEAYIADSENERKDMAAQIESLAADKQSLERRNADFVEENRSLLNQLEALNTAVTESDAHVANLQATLTSTQQEMQRLAQLASRTESLERQLAEFEQEQAIWQSKMEEKELSERSALRRWQTAERTLAQIQDQIEQIEREAKEERERHAEIVGRMERRRVVEQELGSAAGRLKSAAALKNADRDATNDGVVSHFVKDILQDNANLQTGIVELREMLNNSNEEVENLRNQLLLHQPTDESEDVPLPSAERKDLGLEMNRAKSQELHVHHHYHAPPAAPKAPPLRRPKKKRYKPHSNTPPPISTIAIHHQPFQPSLRRAASHESLLSVSGMDIHTLKSRPSQLLAPYANRALTSQAVISDTTAHATRPVPLTRPAAAAGLGKKVGGWVFGRWGATPAPRKADVGGAGTAAAVPKGKAMRVVSDGAIAAGEKSAPTMPKIPKVRSPGINQSGPLLGFFEEVRTLPAAPVLKSLDEEALRDVLGE